MIMDVNRELTVCENLGVRIAKIRNNLKLNQTDYARLIGVTSPISISRYENNRVKPDISLLVKIAESGNVTLDWLLTGKGPKSREEKIVEGCEARTPNFRSYFKDPSLVEILEIIQEDPVAKKFVLKLLRGKKEIAEALDMFHSQIKIELKINE
jgi:transcriptional regulator with XRE-family HTH domain